ncbi:c-type cytochrome [Methylomonas fluvii]|uniref:Class I cytochrome c n=1 Tax=Methylomonas fluvii TaxID=1854564 RepID=A0ABR9DCM5_9GAMM|nr:c-type cytochrome [Methylomonas fluvii]MBD9360855.1 class I cytochrome c [Methylomonas fluvii]
MKRIGYVSAALLASALSSMAYAEIDARAIAFNCWNCHTESSLDAKSSIPSLKSLSAQQLRQALLDFKYDKKPATLMPRLAKGYSDAELAAVAEYLSRY